VKPGRGLRRLGAVIVHNWPLKLGAVILATLMFAGLVASQDSNTYPGPIPVFVENQPPDTVLTNQLRDVEQIRYLAPAEVGNLRAEDFQATVDLADVVPDGNPVTVRVNVAAVDPRVTILEVRPRSIQVILDQKISKEVPVVVDLSEPPEGLEIGEVTVAPEVVTVTGPSAQVNLVVAARVSATIDASAVNVDRDVQPDPVDASGEVVTNVDLDPGLVNIKVPVYENLQNRTVPVNPTVTGTPGAGFRISSVEVAPLVVTVEGDLDQLQALVAADTAPVAVSGATRDVTAEVAYALPTGVTPVGTQTARVTVHIQPVTETRTFTAGLRLDGRQPDLLYELSETRVLLTLYGSSADLDRLDTSPLVISLNVAALEPGVNDVPVVPSLPSAITVAAISPETVTVTVTPRATPTPSPGTSGEPGPGASAPANPAPSPGPSPTPAA
jgi:YbbR domain-containing protein